MGTYWKNKVLPKIKKVFEKNPTKKAAAEACKTFDDSKVEINKEFEEKKTELQPKVIEVYEASSTEVKTVVKERKDVGVKKNSEAVHKFLEELVKIEFPGSKQVYEASSKFGPTLVSGPVFFVFEKVSTFIVTEEKVAAAATSKEKEVVVAEEKKEEEEAVIKEKEVEAAEKSEPTASEPAKVEEEAPKPEK